MESKAHTHTLHVWEVILGERTTLRPPNEKAKITSCDNGKEQWEKADIFRNNKKNDDEGDYFLCFFRYN